MDEKIFSEWKEDNAELYAKFKVDLEEQLKKPYHQTIYQQDRPLCFDYQMIHERFDICLDSIVGDQPVEKENNAEECH